MADKAALRVFFFAGFVCICMYLLFIRISVDLGIRLRKPPGDDKIFREGTVDFYTCSYYMSVCESSVPEITGNA